MQALPGNVRGAAVYHILTNDSSVGTRTVSNGGSVAQLAGYALRGAGLMEVAPKLALFEKTMLPHLDAAHNLARWLTRNEDDAQDVVQEAYLRAFRFFDGFRGGDGRPWLLAVVCNTALTWRSRAKALTHVSFDEEIHGAGLDAATVETQLAEGSKFADLQDCMEL